MVDINLIFVFYIVITCLTVWTDTKLVYKTPTRTGRQQRILTKSIPDVYQTATDLIEGTGLIAETHEVVTEDGYILQAHRLPSSTFNPDKVVILFHGLAGSSDNWMLNGNKSLPNYLHLAGYDVWLGSYRGSTYSSRHLRYKSTNKRYWEYSHHETGVYDNAAFIDLALNVTGAKKVFLIGHSRGTTTSYILLSSRPEYNDKVKLMVSYAPVAYLKNMRKNIFRIFGRWTVRELKQVADTFGRYNFMTITGRSSRNMRVNLCHLLAILQRNDGYINLLVSEDHLNDPARLCFFLSHHPDGWSLTEFLHFAQIGELDRFMPYDYGSPKKNLAKYKTTSPSDYDLRQIRVPIAFYYAENDFLVSPLDVMRLVDKIQNVAGVFKVPYSKFNHLNFAAGRTTDELVYKPTIALMDSYL